MLLKKSKSSKRADALCKYSPFKH